MPRKYNRKKRKTRRRPRRQMTRYRRPPTLTGVSGLFGSPTVRRPMRYQANKTLTNIAGVIDVEVFSANGLWDPDISGSGHQPRWFDQIMPHFNHYCVVGSKIDVNFAHTGNVSPTTPLMCGISRRASATTEPSDNYYIENGATRWVSVPHDASQRKASLTFSAKKYFGKKYTVDNYDLKGSVGANPAEQAYYHIWMSPTTGTEQPNISANILINYIAVFSEPNMVAQS